MQYNTLSRISGGQDVIGIGPEGSGKTTAYVLGILSKLKYGVEEAPRALVLVPDKDAVLAVTELFQRLNKNATIRVVSLYNTPGTESQMDALADGADIVVASPDRARAIYLKLGLNLNKIQVMVVDDAHQIVKQGLQLPVVELANSIQRCQHLIFSEVLHERLELMIDPFMRDPAVIEVDELPDADVEIYEQVLYQVPNFRTKLNLLKLLLSDAETFPKAVVFVNTRLTAEKVYQQLNVVIRGEVALLNPIFFESTGFKSIDDFRQDESMRVLVIANEAGGTAALHDIPFLIHFDIPEEKETFVSRIVKNDEADEDTIAITFCTDLELSEVRKIEQVIGQRLPLAELPEDLIIEKEVGDKDTSKKSKAKPVDPEAPGAAFHEKKASNNKNYNFSSGYKAKLNKKKKHS
ncbi:DEAD/DEAH box helicase [Desertivirga xinjiangensis]|uniref:DEAD/DEAH box helicase n=1 Tax=Desertivirga xinjiangensis TaxID=539206 RepID=UPI00272DDA65|nr:DEAD/DEAH box helicase [Pedobacter xinjiangensis]